jgi:hypothetical protein
MSQDVADENDLDTRRRACLPRRTLLCATVSIAADHAGGAVRRRPLQLPHSACDRSAAPQVVRPACGHREPDRAAGSIGVARVAKAEPDGYALIVISSTFTINAVLQTKQSFDAQTSFAPVVGDGRRFCSPRRRPFR